MTENEKLAMLSISFKINSEFEAAWEHVVKNNPHITRGGVTIMSPEQLKMAFQDLFLHGASIGVRHYRAEHKV